MSESVRKLMHTLSGLSLCPNVNVRLLPSGGCWHSFVNELRHPLVEFRGPIWIGVRLLQFLKLEGGAKFKMDADFHILKIWKSVSYLKWTLTTTFSKFWRLASNLNWRLTSKVFRSLLPSGRSLHPIQIGRRHSHNWVLIIDVFNTFKVMWNLASK